MSNGKLSGTDVIAGGIVTVFVVAILGIAFVWEVVLPVIGLLHVLGYR